MHTTDTTTGDTAVRREVADTLEAAADYLDQYGWCRGSLYQHTTDHQPRACALGSVYMVLFGEPLDPFDIVSHESPVTATHARAVIAYLADYLNEHGDWPFDLACGEVVSDWNDYHAHTGTDVTATLRAAAGDYRERRAS